MLGPGKSRGGVKKSRGRLKELTDSDAPVMEVKSETKDELRSHRGVKVSIKINCWEDKLGNGGRTIFMGRYAIGDGLRREKDEEWVIPGSRDRSWVL